MGQGGFRGYRLAIVAAAVFLAAGQRPLAWWEWLIAAVVGGLCLLLDTGDLELGVKKPDGRAEAGRVRPPHA